MITVKTKGDFKNTFRFFKKAKDKDYTQILNQYGEIGVSALMAATPKDTGKTAASWTYKVVGTDSGAKIEWHNTNVNDGVCIAVILQFGHGTGTGGYVTGIDYINPAMASVFEGIAEKAWNEVVKS